jgi:WD40 repeat protein
VRVLSLPDGRELLNASAHTDWVFGATIGAGGANVGTEGRDRAVKRMEVRAAVAAAAPTPAPDGKRPTLPRARDGIRHRARHRRTRRARDVRRPQPSGSDTDIAVVGAADGAARIYRVADLKPRTEAEKDPNRSRECERMAGPINAAVFSADGKSFALAATREARVFDRDGNRTAMLTGHDGPLYALAFTPDRGRVFDAKDGKLLREFAPFTR